MGKLCNVLGASDTGNSQRQASNGSILMLGKSAGAGSGNVIFMYTTDGRNGTGYSANPSGRIVYTPNGGSDVDFMVEVGDNVTSPYPIVSVGTNATYAYTDLASGSSSGGGGWLRMSGSTSVTFTGANCTGLKIANPDPGQSVTLTGTGTPNNGIIMTGSNDFTISGGFISSDYNSNSRAYDFHQQSSGTLTVSSVLNQTGANNCVIKSGPGRLVLSGANTYTGPTYFDEGTLTAGIAQNGTTNGPFGANGTLYFAGGTLQYSADTGIAITDYSPRFSTSAGQPISIDTNGRDVTLGTALNSPGGTLTKSGAGTLTCTAANSYTGLTTVKAGTLQLNGWDVGPPPSDMNAWAPVLTGGGADIQGAVGVSSKLVFDYTGGTSPALTIDGLMKASYNGDTYGVGLWDVGQFRSTTAAATGLTLGWKDDPGTKQVTVMATYAGDANLDGEVDGADVDIWKLNVGSSLAPPPGGAGLSASIVPEPSTLVLLAIGLAALAGWMIRRRK
jgi:autotransporter-associated beta strand protein